MDIQCNELFSVEFFSNFKYNSQEAQLKESLKFYKSISEACDAQRYVTIKENKKILIRFQSICDESKLYMEGLEMLDYRLIDGNEGSKNSYIKPNKKLLTLYENGNYPLIPGNYVVKILCKEVEYFSMFKVIHKFLQNDEAESIKVELEKELNGLAFELIRRNLSLGDSNKVKDLPIELFKFLAIKEKFSMIMAALIDLSDKPNYKISKYHKTVQIDKVKVLDNIGVKKYLKSQVKNGYMYAPIKYFDYNLPENRYLKKILEYIALELKKFINIIDNSIESKINLLEEKKFYKDDIGAIRIKNETIVYLNELKEVAIKIKISINVLKSKDWYSTLEKKQEYILPHSMIQDARYNILYKLYRELKAEKFSIMLDSNYSVQMKKTDKLYEMWCYVKISKILNEVLNFNIEGGWLFEQNLYKQQVIVPELIANTRVRFKKNNISMNLVYDSKIPRVYSGTNKEEIPIYTIQNSNRPDGRLDVYTKDSYIGSIIFEFKYRDRKFLWTLNEKNENCITKQLRDYASGCKTKHGYIKNLEVVQSVIVLCPLSTGDKEIKEEEDYHLTFINLKPKKNEELVANEISKAIDNLIQNYEDIKNGRMS